MKRMRRLGMPLVAITVLVLTVGVRSAGAQTKEVRGLVTSVSDSWFAVKAGQQDVTISVDSRTRVEASGAGRQTRRVREAGGSGIKITEYVKVGGAVLVSYSETNDVNVAIWVRPIATAGPGGGSTTEAARIASGKVTSITPDALTLTRDGKALTFAIDNATKVSAPGAGRASRAAGGRIPITALVGNGDIVSITYRNAGAAMNASQVRVTVKSR